MSDSTTDRQHATMWASERLQVKGSLRLLDLELTLPRKSFTLHVQLQMPQGSLYGLFGPSAAGKSSILQVLAGFEKNAVGRFLLDEEVIFSTTQTSSIRQPPWQRQIGFVEQNANLFPHITVLQNILFSTKGKSTSWQEKVIDRLSLRPYLQMRPALLSGGLAQRVSLARALVRRPKLLLLDEPLSALDWEARNELQDVIMDIQREIGCTTLLVTHQLSEAQKMCEQIGIMDRGQLLQLGTPSDVMDHPASPRVAQLVGYEHFLDLRGVMAAERIAIHPDRIVLGYYPDQGVCLTGIIQDIVLQGGQKRMKVSLEHTQKVISASLLPTQTVSVGQLVTLTAIHPPHFAVHQMP